MRRDLGRELKGENKVEGDGAGHPSLRRGNHGGLPGGRGLAEDASGCRPAPASFRLNAPSHAPPRRPPGGTAPTVPDSSRACGAQRAGSTPTHTAQTRGFSAAPSPLCGWVWLTRHGAHVPLQPAENRAEGPCHRVKGPTLNGHGLRAGSTCSDSGIALLGHSPFPPGISGEGGVLAHLLPPRHA